LRAAAERLREERDRAEAKRALAAQRKREREEAKARDARLDALARRGEAAAWRDVEELIGRRNNLAYDKRSRFSSTCANWRFGKARTTFSTNGWWSFEPDSGPSNA
jgi:hypothetical protein